MLETEPSDSKLIEKKMKQCHRNHQAEVSAKNGKKGRKLKKNHSVEACKCFTPFVKLHCWHCPEVNKPCSIHRNVLCQNIKPQKVETDQNLTISFHPSSRTEKLFEPVKSLLAQCDPETKINFQFFSPTNITDKENFKNEIIQTSFENLKMGSGCNYVEKKKSSVNDKTNKMKKLKECFHSPCNSITQKYPSPPPVRRNLNEILNEDATPQPWQNFFNGDVNVAQSSDWFSSNPFGFKKLEKMTADKRDSDFITVTQHDKDNVINHKIFEIDHRKGMNEIPLTGFGKQPTHFAYSSFNVNYPNDSRMNKYNSYEGSKKPQAERGDMQPRYSQTSVASSGSVYVTPFILMPPGWDPKDDNDSFEESFDNGKRSVGVQVKEGECECEEKPKLITKYVQITGYESSDSASEQKMNTVSLQTDPRTIKKCPMGCTCSSEDTISEKFSYNEKVVQTNIRDNTVIDTATVKGKFKTTEVQTSNRYQVKEVLITRYNKPTKEAGNQVQSSGYELQDGGSSGAGKSLVPHPSFANKRTQVSNPTSERNMEDDDTRSQKYDSDSDYYERRKDERQEYTVTQTTSSRSPERFRNNARSANDERTSPVSDLSELKRIISEFFERAACNCKEREYEMSRKNRENVDTMTEDPKNTQKKGNSVSRETQTVETSSNDKGVEAGSALEGGEGRYRQSVFLDDDQQPRTNYVCSFCGRNINRYSMNAGTNTDDMYPVNKQTTIIETDLIEVTKIKKSKDPSDPSKKSITTSTKQTIRPVAYYKTDNQKMTRTLSTQTTSRSNIPVPVSTAPAPAKNEKQNRPREPQEVAKLCSLSNCPARTREQNERRVVPQPTKDCSCSDLPDEYTPRSGISCPYKNNRSDDANNQGRYREDPRERKDSQKQPNRHFYHVTVNPPWPRDLTNAWKSQELSGDSLKRGGSQKTGFEKGGLSNETFCIKDFTEIENCESEKQNSSDVEKTKKLETSKKENFGFPRMPFSSASQISMKKGTHYQSKIIKSEESVKALNQALCCTPLNIFAEDVNDIYTVKSCHLNPIKIACNGQSCDEIIACSNCKSLVLLKFKNDDPYVQGSTDHIQNQNTLTESEEKILADEVPDRQFREMYSLARENVDEQEEEYVEKSSNFSDRTARTTENDFFKEENSDADNK